MAERATSLSIAVLIVALAGFVWWNLQPGSASLVSDGPEHIVVEYRGPGWPVPECSARVWWARPNVPAAGLLRPCSGANRWARADDGERPTRFSVTERPRWLYNAPVGALLVVALIANLVRSHRDAWRSGDRDRYHRWVGYSVLVGLALVALALLVTFGTEFGGLER